MEKNNTGLIVGVSAAVVLGIIITVVVVKSSNKDQTVYNPNLYPSGYNPNAPYGSAQNPYVNNNDKAALYTGAASVLNNIMDTFFAPKSKTTASNTSSNSSDEDWNAQYGDIWY